MAGAEGGGPRGGGGRGVRTGGGEGGVGVHVHKNKGGAGQYSRSNQVMRVQFVVQYRYTAELYTCTVDTHGNYTVYSALLSFNIFVLFCFLINLIS